jgi:hypothetical protein
MYININTFGDATFENGGAKHTLAPPPNCAYASKYVKLLNIYIYLRKLYTPRDLF